MQHTAFTGEEACGFGPLERTRKRAFFIWPRGRREDAELVRPLPIGDQTRDELVQIRECTSTFRFLWSSLPFLSRLTTIAAAYIRCG